MDRLSPQDSWFLHIENRVNHMHVGAVLVFGGPAPSHARLRRMVMSKLPLAPRLRQRLQFVSFQLGRPAWVDDCGFDLDHHLRRVALPPPGSRAQLETLVGGLISRQLDRARPLWELWMVEGLEDGRWALLAKVHHCLVDGVAGIGLLTAVLDSGPEAAWPAPVAWHPNAPPSRLRLVGGAGIDFVVSRYRQRRALGAALHRPERALRLFSDTVVRLTRPDPHWLAGPIGPSRRWSSACVPLEDVKRARARLGGTVNDIALAAITCGFRELLATGDHAGAWVPRTLVPVSMRRARDGGPSGNRLSAAFVQLPVNVDDPVERLARIRGERDHAKQSGQASAAQTLTTLAELAPPPLLALSARLATRLVARFGSGVASTVTTNIPGPDSPLYACGRRLEAIYPFAPIASPLRIGVTIFSYDGRLTFGVTADHDTVPDVAVMCRGIETGIAELLNLVGSPLRPGSAAG